MRKISKLNILASVAIPRIYGIRFIGIYAKTCQHWKRQSVKVVKAVSIWICFLLRCLRYPLCYGKHAYPSIPDTSEEWLDGFNTFSIYHVLSKLIELWGLNVLTDVQSKKLHPTDNTAVSAPLCTTWYLHS
jgi:hypothetical protein